MRDILITFLVFTFFYTGFSQTKKKEQEVDIITHEVKFGESIRLLSKKYLVDPAEIYKLNKFAVDGISEGMVLKIPVPKKAGIVEKETDQTEKVVPIVNENEVTKTKQPIKEESIPTSNNDIKQIVITENKTEINHKVIAKETLYSLARDYNVSVEDIKTNNPEVAKSGLQIGQIVKILTNKQTDIMQSSSITTPVKESNTSTTTSNTIKHKVLPKETFYSLSKKYNVSVDDIKKQNENLLINGLQVGQVLEIKPNN
jgi:LysM repeat protein